MSEPKSDVKMELSGFKVSRDLKHYLDKKIAELRDLSPMSSFINLVISTRNKEILGEITINSPEQNFKARIKDTSIANVVLHLCDDVQRQINLWKRMRFFGGMELKKAET